ncbi:MAG: putative sulfate exporter family transporter [Phycisphaeraceae bacterium]|nr:putative sulfate exporter family transporter [Phycisphaeraceae bacterium]
MAYDITDITMDPYHNPQVAQWLGSLEGVPDWSNPAHTRAVQAGRAPWRQPVYDGFAWLGDVAPGITLALAMALLGTLLSLWLGVDLLGYSESPISAILAAVLLGVVIRNTVGLPAIYEKGLALCLKRVLRLGIILLGIRLSLLQAGTTGVVALPIVLGCIISALVLVSWFNRKLGLPRRLGSLIAVGTSICGVSAIVATAPVIDAEDDETSYAVATIALFGMMALFTYPFLAHLIFGERAAMVGLFLGTAIHDTSQVAGAGLSYQQQYAAPVALDTAVVTKLVRNLCMIWVIPLMAVLYHRGNLSKDKTPHWFKAVPLFVLGFIAFVALRTVGDLGDRPFGVLSPTTWSNCVNEINWLAGWCLTIAMAAVGLGTNLHRLVRMGPRPFFVGLAAATVVGGVSIILVWLVAARLTGFYSLKAGDAVP